MDVRIGVTDSPRELTVDLGDEVDRDALKKATEAALDGESKVFWLTDKKGREVGVASAKIAYIELGSSDDTPDIGFGSS